MYFALISALWIGWAIYWILAARGLKTVSRRETLGSRLSYLIPLLIGSALLIGRRVPDQLLSHHFLSPALRLPAYWMGIAFVVLGLGFSVWARRHLAGNWSGTITLKEGHELIRTGPYRWVRHPIYTGLLLAVIGSALAGARYGSLIATVFIAGGLIRKLTLEERLMAENFPDSYAKYRAEVSALIPLIF